MMEEIQVPIYLTLKTCAARENVLLALARAGYEVWVEEHDDGAKGIIFYIVIDPSGARKVLTSPEKKERKNGSMRKM